jgi:hypothetical protein
LKNEKENKEMLETLPHVPDEPVNIFFKENLGLDKGNLLVFTASFRPALLLPMDYIKKYYRKLTTKQKPKKYAKPARTLGGLVSDQM